MKETTKKTDTLALVQEHQSINWKFGSSYGINFHNINIVANDLRTLAGLAGYNNAKEANKLCLEMMSIAVNLLECLSKHIEYWERDVQLSDGIDVLNALKKYEENNANVYIPSANYVRIYANALHIYAQSFAELMLIDEILGENFAEHLAILLYQCAYIMDKSADWIICLMRYECKETLN